ncbi:MAG TPA: Gfo/Idh/MocA family oxidoreductase [Allosphingosinicella sp.]|uniref:Gfo/Idh/MocA family protein n=1 Tax=Allosphingosinicella sp. TaxID=2823234 RepID=UPI002EDA9A18
MRPLRIGIIGFGKIAADQHVPAIAGHPRLELAATVSRQGKGVEGVPCFTSHQEMLEADLGLEAVAITTPPGVRYAIARDCIEAGLHCSLEKPPTVTLSEIEDLACLTEGRQVTLQTTWHSQHNPAVAAAAQALAGKRIASMQVTWHEDVRKWHPGQDWIFEAGGFGVFDPGINAFSILMKIFPGALFVCEAELRFPENRQAPIAAEIACTSPVADGDLRCSLNFLHSGGEAWNIDISTADGIRLSLREGGSKLEIDGAPQSAEGEGEYPSLYREFVDLIDARRSLVDVRPLSLVADAFLLGRRATVEAFDW